MTTDELLVAIMLEIADWFTSLWQTGVYHTTSVVKYLCRCYQARAECEGADHPADGI